MSTDDLTQPDYPTEPTLWTPPPPPPPAPRQRPPRRGGALWGCFGVGLGFIAGVIVTALLALALFAARPAAPAASAPNAVPSGVALRVTLTDALLTRQLEAAERNATGGVLAQPHAHIQADGKIIISGTLAGAGSFSGSKATVVALPYVSQGVLAVKLTDATVGGFPVPLSAVSAIRDQMNQQLAQSSRLSAGAGVNLVVNAVSFSDGALTLSYVVG